MGDTETGRFLPLSTYHYQLIGSPLAIENLRSDDAEDAFPNYTDHINPNYTNIDSMFPPSQKYMNHKLLFRFEQAFSQQSPNEMVK